MLKPLLHDSRWNEIILLTAGHLSEFSPYQATRFIWTILDMKSEYEHILHRDWLMAVRCLADDIRVDAELRRTVLSQLLKVYFAPKSPPALQDDIRQACSRLSGTIFGIELSKKLAECLSNRRKSIRQAAARALGRLGAAAATPEVVTALPHALADPDRIVRSVAATAVGQLGVVAATPEVLTALLHTLADQDRNVRWAAVSGLQRLSGYVRLSDRSAMVKLLLPLARSSEAEYRDVGYVSLRNLLATEPVSDVSHALASPTE